MRFRLLLHVAVCTLTSSNDTETKLLYKVDASAEGCTGVFWRVWSQSSGRYVTGSQQADPPWPRNGAIVEGKVSTIDPNFLVVHANAESLDAELALPFHDEDRKYTYLHPVAQGSEERIGLLPASSVGLATVFDVLILGSGPAGLTAAIYAARSAWTVLVIGGPSPGGAMMLSKAVENFPSSSGSGADIMSNLVKQTAGIGVNFHAGSVSAVRERAPPCIEAGAGACFTADVTDGSSVRNIHSRTVIVASGATEKWLGIENEEELYGRSLHTCAYCDARFYSGQEVCVIGGGDGALEAAAYLARVARKVTIIHRKESWRGSATAAARLERLASVEVVRPYYVHEWIVMDGKLLGASVKHSTWGSKMEARCSGAFVMIGREPQTKFLPAGVSRDARGFILHNRLSMTTVPGMFAAGQVADARYQQAVTAAAGGAQAAIDASRWLAGELEYADGPARLRGMADLQLGSLRSSSWSMFYISGPTVVFFAMVVFSPCCRRHISASSWTSWAEWAKTS